MSRIPYLAVIPCVLAAGNCLSAEAIGDRPNVVLIMSDDQGYGDFGATGNPVMETPHIDALARSGAWMKTFYVCPVCSPTRAGLMTGRYNYRTRCIDTYIGRSMMDPAEVTIAEVLGDAGYDTGIFGKWHLGDSYPMRAIDQGFDEALVHRGGGLAQPSEPLENNRRYTNPILFHNGEQVQTRGFCTDVYFDAAMDFISQSHDAGRNFFVYLPSNTPHSPFHDVPRKLYEHYLQKNLTPLNVTSDAADAETLASICAMVTNIDQNVGKLADHLDRLQLAENTIVISMVDNGPNTLRYVGPFRGKKAQVYEGGVRSPFWMRWPARLKAGTTSDVPVAQIDVFPTLLEACGVAIPDDLAIDGRSFLPLLLGGQVEWPERYLATQAHRGNVPVRYHQFLIRDNRWKLLHPSGFGNESFDGPPRFELYDLLADPGETRNLADERPEIVQRLKTAYDEWFDDVSSTRPDNYAPPRIHVGSPHENPTVLTHQDWRIKERGDIGHWEIRIVDPGPYDVELLFQHPVSAGQVELTVGGESWSQEVNAGAKSGSFERLTLPTGDATLQAIWTNGEREVGAYHVVLERN